MKKILTFLIFLLLIGKDSSAQNNQKIRKVLESKTSEAWKVDGKFIKPECFIEEWVSGDNYEIFFDRYIGKFENSYREQKGVYKKFVEEIGNYLNKEVPINDIIKTGWSSPAQISLTTKLKSCLSNKAETYVEYNDDGSRYTIKYKVTKSFDPSIGKELAPNFSQNFDSIKQISLEFWGGGSMSAIPNPIVYGVINFKEEKILLPLRNKSMIDQEKKTVNISSINLDQLYKWIKNQTEHKSANSLMWDKEERFKSLIKSEIFVSETKTFLSNLMGPPNEIFYYENRRYVATSACKAHECPAKAFVFFDTDEKFTIGLLRDYDGDFRIYSKTHKEFKDLPKVFNQAVKDWMKVEGISKKKVFFIGLDKSKIEVTNKFMG